MSGGSRRQQSAPPRDHAEASLAASFDFLSKITPSFLRGTNPMHAIRRKCLDCACGQPGEIRNCEIMSCALWPYRLGRNPFRRDASKKVNQ